MRIVMYCSDSITRTYDFVTNPVTISGDGLLHQFRLTGTPGSVINVYIDDILQFTTPNNITADMNFGDSVDSPGLYIGNSLDGTIYEFRMTKGNLTNNSKNNDEIVSPIVLSGDFLTGGSIDVYNPVAFDFDTANVLGTPIDLLFRLRNKTEPKFEIDKEGNIFLVGMVDGVDISSIPANYTDAAITAKVLGAGYLASAGTVAIGDSLEIALEKLDGNIAAAAIVANAALPKAGGQISGNITCLGAQTFDGVDISDLALKVGIYRNLNVVDNVTTDDDRNVTGLASALAFAIDLRSKILAHSMSIGAHASADPYSWVYHNEVATVSGTALGVITVADASVFSIDDLVYIDNTIHIPYAVGYIESITIVNPGVQEEIHVTIGSGGGGGDVDLSAYTVALGAHIWLSLDAHPANPTTLATLITFIGFLKSGYILHDDDAELGAAWLYHIAQEAGDHSINPALPITTLAEVIIVLTEFKTKYDAHVADTTTHTLAVGATVVAAPANGFATTIIDAAALSGDKIQWAIIDNGVATVRGVSAIASTGFITFTFDADPASDVVLSYSLFRAN
jgi:hypothetical protein